MRVGVTQIRFIGEGSLFRASSGIFLKAAWVLYSSEKGSTIAGDLQASEIAKTIILVVKGGELVRKFRRKAAVKCAAFQIPIEPFLHANHGSNLFLQQVKTIAAPTQTVPWVRDVGVRAVHTVERLRLYGGAGACQSYLQDV